MLRLAACLAFLTVASLPAQQLSSRALATVSIQERVEKRTTPEALTLYSKYSPPGEFVRSKTSWASDLDFSGLSVWNTANLDNTGGNRGYGTLITRRVVVFAQHFHPGPGTMLVFLGREGQLHWRKLVDTQRVLLSDICLGLLDKEVPETVAVYPILPPEYVAQPPPPVPKPDMKLVPIICLNQSRQAVVHQWFESSLAIGHQPTRQPEGSHGVQMAVGDSGAPIFLLLDRQLVLLGCHHTANAAPSLAALAKEVDAVVARWEAGKVRRVKWN